MHRLLQHIFVHFKHDRITAEIYIKQRFLKNQTLIVISNQ